MERPFTQVIFLCKAELGVFQILEIVTGWLVPPGWYLPPQKILLAENRFLQAGKGAENTKEKSRQCFTAPKTKPQKVGPICME
jgi:hypothetical protein